MEITRNLKRAEEKLSTKFTLFQVEAEKVLAKALTAELMKWKKRFPKRSLHFYDSMGVQSIRVDGKSIDFPSYPWSDSRFRPIFQPLYDLVTWYCHRSDEFHISVEEIKL